MNRSQALNAARDVLRRKHMALATEDTYLHWIGRYCQWLSEEAPQPLPETSALRMEAFLTKLAKIDDVAASTQNQAFSAILFFYRHVLKQEPGDVNALRANRPVRMRFAPNRDDVRSILSAVQDSPQYPYRLILCLIYGCGLRVSEPLNIRLRDLDLPNRRLIVREAKGNKDRMVPIPASLIDPINWQIARARLTWQRAVSLQIPAKLPHSLGRKYRNAGFEQPWFWLFPAASACTDPRSQTGALVWWHCLPTSIQKALRKAAKQTGHAGSITPHHLRHAWATHALDAGASVRDLQEILGHKSLETTMLYAHPQIERVNSPLDSLGIANIAPSNQRLAS